MDHTVHKIPSLRSTIDHTASPGYSSFILHVAYDSWLGPLYTLFHPHPKPVNSLRWIVISIFYKWGMPREVRALSKGPVATECPGRDRTSDSYSCNIFFQLSSIYWPSTDSAPVSSMLYEWWCLISPGTYSLWGRSIGLPPLPPLLLALLHNSAWLTIDNSVNLHSKIKL